MPLRNRNGKLEWRFQVDGHTYSQITDLEDTKRNRSAAAVMEADARKKVLEGRPQELKPIRLTPFINAADEFSDWADGEYCEHPDTAKRYRVSLTSAKAFFQNKPLSAIGAGGIENYKTFRRKTHEVEEITVRHDLHALSLLFKYGIKHHYCLSNPVGEVKIPSDKNAVRETVLTDVQEKALLGAIDAMITERSAKRDARGVKALSDIRDLVILMLNQGPRPEELRALPQASVNLDQRTMTICKRGAGYLGKSEGARRILKLTEPSCFILSERLRERGKWVFPARKGAGHVGQHQRLWETVIKRAKLDEEHIERNLVMYDMRHTFATRAIERGMTAGELMVILGHASMRSIMRYVHMTDAHVDAGMRKFEQGEPNKKRVNDTGDTEEQRLPIQ